MKRQIKEYKLCNNSNICANVGTMDKKNPKVIYITMRTWLSYRNETHSSLFDTFSCFKRKMVQIMSQMGMDSKYIFDYDVSEGTLEKSDKTFLIVQLMMRQYKTSDSIDTFYQSNMKHLNEMVSVLEDTFNYHGYECKRKRR